MKLSGSLSTLLVLLPIMVAAAPNPAATAAAAANSTVALDASHRKINAANNNPQTSLTLDPKLIGPNLAQNGLGNGSEVGQVASLTSTNNFINFCIGKTITNGEQVETGSCNPVPMGNIPAKTKQTSSKFVFPKNLDNVQANTAFTIQMKINNLQTGFFVNPKTNYYAAPQQLNGGGVIQGHSHVVVQAVKGLQDTGIPDPTIFAFFQGLNAKAQNGILTSNVAKGLPAGTYRLTSINTAANHQPVLMPVAQHGAIDDAVYFTVGAADAAAAAKIAGASGAAGAANNTAAAAKGAASAAPAAAKAASSAAPAAAKAASTAPAAKAATPPVVTAAKAGTPPVATAAAAKAAQPSVAAGKTAKVRRSFMIARQN